MDVLKFGFRYWKRNLGWSVLAKLMSALALTADLMLPMLTAMFINYIIKDEEPQNEGIFGFLLSGKYGQIHTMKLFWHIALVFVSLLFAKEILVYLKGVLNQKLGLRLETDLRMVSFHKLMNLDSDTLSSYNTGELLTIINSDTIMFKELFCRIIPNIFDSVFVLVTAITILANIHVGLLWIPVILIPFFAAALLKFRSLAKKNFRAIRGCNSKMSLAVQENIEAVRLVRSFTNEDREKKKFDSINGELKGAYVNQVKLSAKFEAVFGTIKQIAYIGSVAVGAVLVMKGYLLIGYLVTCTEYVSKIMTYITMINNMMFQMQQQIVSGQKLMNFMACETGIPDGTEEILQRERIDIRIRNASMVIGDSRVLTDIDLDIPYGKKVGIVGETGSGKSLLLESFIRVHDMTAGTIELNGRDIREYTLESLRDKFSYVFQDVFLFSNTIDSNIAYAKPDVEEEMVREAAIHAQAAGFIEKLEDGYQTIVGERGLGISGGQKQRVSIARALLKNAPVLVLDDSTSALDADTEKRLLADIKAYFPNKTLLIAAHRLSSVVDCDEILYMQGGAIVERGSFQELMNRNGHFASVYRTQQAQQERVMDFDALAERGV